MSNAPFIPKVIRVVYYDNAEIAVGRHPKGQTRITPSEVAMHTLPYVNHRSGGSAL